MQTAGRMRARLVLLAFVVLAAGSIPWAAHAEEHVVSLGSSWLDPPTLQAAKSDVITWTVDSGSHHLQAYQGGTLDHVFGAPGDSYSFTFNGGVLRYRCTVHTTLTSGGVCSGQMCGIIADQHVDQTPPRVAITTPKNRSAVAATPSNGSGGSIQNFVDFAGTASDETSIYGVSLTVFDVGGKGKDYATACNGCGFFTANWTAHINLTPGFYTIIANAADSAGNIARTPSIQVVVL